jgi:N-acetylglucosaminyl-diphospho-decaprenol L-rhamnosyltransferase
VTGAQRAIVGWLVRLAVFRCGARLSTYVGGFDERYFMYMEDVDLGDLVEPGGLAQRLRAGSAGMPRRQGSFAPAGIPARNLRAHHDSTDIDLSDRHVGVVAGARCGGR